MQPSLAPEGTMNMGSMKAIVQHRYGSADVLELREVDLPAVGDDAVLLRVHAASVNPLDWHYMTGTPYITRLEAGLRQPKQGIRGADVAGVVEAVGKTVTDFHVGDEVFGATSGSFAEYVCVSKKSLVGKPASLSFEQAAAAPIAALTALQGLRDKGKVRPGQKVLINGAAGGVGTYAVQIAKDLGAEVTGVCSTGNIDLVRSLGADHVIDYTKDDFAAGEMRYDVLLDNVGNRSLSACKRALNHKGFYVPVGAPKKGRVLGPVKRLVRTLCFFALASQKTGPFLATVTKADLTVLSELMESGKVVSVIDRRYRLSQTPDALRYLELGHARGKIIITG